MSDQENSLIGHLEALRRTLLSCLIATALLYPGAFLASPYVISSLVRWSFPPEAGKLHYFAPMEVFWVQLKLALVLAMALAYPWNILQVWRFLLPALYREERRTLGWWIVVASILFFGGVVFCGALILPMLMKFSGGFATPELQPMLGLANFLELAGWLMLSFGVMFQAPLLVLLAVRFGLISTEALRRKRPWGYDGDSDCRSDSHAAGCGESGDAGSADLAAVRSRPFLCPPAGEACRGGNGGKRVGFSPPEFAELSLRRVAFVQSCALLPLRKCSGSTGREPGRAALQRRAPS